MQITMHNNISQWMNHNTPAAMRQDTRKGNEHLPNPQPYQNYHSGQTNEAFLLNSPLPFDAGHRNSNNGTRNYQTHSPAAVSTHGTYNSPVMNIPRTTGEDQTSASFLNNSRDIDFNISAATTPSRGTTEGNSTLIIKHPETKPIEKGILTNVASQKHTLSHEELKALLDKVGLSGSVSNNTTSPAGDASVSKTLSQKSINGSSAQTNGHGNFNFNGHMYNQAIATPTPLMAHSVPSSNNTRTANSPSVSQPQTSQSKPSTPILPNSTYNSNVYSQNMPANQSNNSLKTVNSNPLSQKVNTSQQQQHQQQQQQQQLSQQPSQQKQQQQHQQHQHHQQQQQQQPSQQQKQPQQQQQHQQHQHRKQQQQQQQQQQQKQQQQQYQQQPQQQHQQQLQQQQQQQQYHQQPQQQHQQAQQYQQQRQKQKSQPQKSQPQQPQQKQQQPHLQQEQQQQQKPQQLQLQRQNSQPQQPQQPQQLQQLQLQRQRSQPHQQHLIAHSPAGSPTVPRKVSTPVNTNGQVVEQLGNGSAEKQLLKLIIEKNKTNNELVYDSLVLLQNYAAQQNFTPEVVGRMMVAQAAEQNPKDRNSEYMLKTLQLAVQTPMLKTLNTFDNPMESNIQWDSVFKKMKSFIDQCMNDLFALSTTSLNSPIGLLSTPSSFVNAPTHFLPAQNNFGVDMLKNQTVNGGTAHYQQSVNLSMNIGGVNFNKSTQQSWSIDFGGNHQGNQVSSNVTNTSFKQHHQQQLQTVPGQHQQSKELNQVKLQHQKPKKRPKKKKEKQEHKFPEHGMQHQPQSHQLQQENQLHKNQQHPQQLGYIQQQQQQQQQQLEQNHQQKQEQQQQPKQPPTQQDKPPPPPQQNKQQKQQQEQSTQQKQQQKTPQQQKQQQQQHTQQPEPSAQPKQKPLHPNKRVQQMQPNEPFDRQLQHLSYQQLEQQLEQQQQQQLQYQLQQQNQQQQLQLQQQNQQQQHQLHQQKQHEHLMTQAEESKKKKPKSSKTNKDKPNIHPIANHDFTTHNSAFSKIPPQHQIEPNEPEKQLPVSTSLNQVNHHGATSVTNTKSAFKPVGSSPLNSHKALDGLQGLYFEKYQEGGDQSKSKSLDNNSSNNTQRVPTHPHMRLAAHNMSQRSSGDDDTNSNLRTPPRTPVSDAKSKPRSKSSTKKSAKKDSACFPAGPSPPVPDINEAYSSFMQGTMQKLAASTSKCSTSATVVVSTSCSSSTPRAIPHHSIPPSLLMSSEVNLMTSVRSPGLLSSSREQVQSEKIDIHLDRAKSLSEVVSHVSVPKKTVHPSAKMAQRIQASPNRSPQGMRPAPNMCSRNTAGHGECLTSKSASIVASVTSNGSIRFDQVDQGRSRVEESPNHTQVPYRGTIPHRDTVDQRVPCENNPKKFKENNVNNDQRMVGEITKSLKTNEKHVCGTTIQSHKLASPIPQGGVKSFVDMNAEINRMDINAGRAHIQSPHQCVNHVSPFKTENSVLRSMLMSKSPLKSNTCRSEMKDLSTKANNASPVANGFQRNDSFSEELRVIRLIEVVDDEDSDEDCLPPGYFTKVLELVDDELETLPPLGRVSRVLECEDDDETFFKIDSAKPSPVLCSPTMPALQRATDQLPSIRYIGQSPPQIKPSKHSCSELTPLSFFGPALVNMKSDRSAEKKSVAKKPSAPVAPPQLMTEGTRRSSRATSTKTQLKMFTCQDSEDEDDGSDNDLRDEDYRVYKPTRSQSPDSSTSPGSPSLDVVEPTTNTTGESSAIVVTPATTTSPIVRPMESSRMINNMLTTVLPSLSPCATNSSITSVSPPQPSGSDTPTSKIGEPWLHSKTSSSPLVSCESEKPTTPTKTVNSPNRDFHVEESTATSATSTTTTPNSPLLMAQLTSSTAHSNSKSKPSPSISTSSYRPALSSNNVLQSQPRTVHDIVSRFKVECGDKYAGNQLIVTEDGRACIKLLRYLNHPSAKDPTPEIIQNESAAPMLKSDINSNKNDVEQYKSSPLKVVLNDCNKSTNSPSASKKRIVGSREVEQPSSSNSKKSKFTEDIGNTKRKLKLEYSNNSCLVKKKAKNQKKIFKLQTKPCGKFVELPRCLDCKSDDNGEAYCRFNMFRKLDVSDPKRTLVTGFSDPNSASEKDLPHWIYQHNSDLDIDLCEHILKDISVQFQQLVLQELDAKGWSGSEDPVWKQAVLRVREMCDICSTTVFNMHWTCPLCGLSVCPDCYRSGLDYDKGEKNVPYSWPNCDTGHHHTEQLIVTQIIPKNILVDLLRDLLFVSKKINLKFRRLDKLKYDGMMIGVEQNTTRSFPELGELKLISEEDLFDEPQDSHALNSRPLPPGCKRFCNGRLVHIENPNFTSESDTMMLFREEFRNGIPVIVSHVRDRLDKTLWTPKSLSDEFSGEVYDIVNCYDGSIIQDFPIARFWDGFENVSVRPIYNSEPVTLLKLKDWPPKENFSKKLPRRFTDIMQALPAPSYTHRDGHLNLAARLPNFFAVPDLGPKMYNAYGSASYPRAGTTNLHLDISDATNVIAYVGIPQDEEHGRKETEDTFKVVDLACCEATKRRIREPGVKPGALWHIFPAHSACKIRRFLRRVAEERGMILSDSSDPIHDQSFYLDLDLLKQLKTEEGVEGYAICQCEGDAVFIPAGAPHQVLNLHSCIKVAEDFVAPDHITHCFQLTQEFRYLSDHHTNHEDKLQIKNILFHAVKDCLGVLKEHHKL